MTPRETVIEAAAKAICATFRMPSNKHTDCFSWDGLFLWDDLLEEERNAFRATARTHLDAILAALPGLGLKVVPVEATAKMMREFWLAGPFPAKPWKDGYAAMLAAAPDPLGSGK